MRNDGKEGHGRDGGDESGVGTQLRKSREEKRECWGEEKWKVDQKMLIAWM